MTESDTQKLKALSAELIPTVWIGKCGVNNAIVLELRRQLKLRKMVKAKILKAALVELSREEIAHELEHASGARLVDLKGATAVYLSPYRIKKTAQKSHTYQRK
ncbi:MAG TPA: YhbY family RNA-binding protein [Candidatus Bathyarchaeia archaeon]|nr:YhbY family RNA-binding protein [Candidatus Bathyarchaeia archaeon]